VRHRSENPTCECSCSLRPSAGVTITGHRRGFLLNLVQLRTVCRRSFGRANTVFLELTMPFRHNGKSACRVRVALAVDRMVPGSPGGRSSGAPMRDASSEPGCSRDQEQPSPDDDGSDGPRDALTGRCETFDGDGCRHDSHCAQVHDPDDEEDRR
jgi:hypothetical protein